MHSNRQAAAFTLIELLIVIAIIAMLLSMVLPSLAMTRLTMQRTQCSANMRTLSLATFMYMDSEGRGLFPGVDTPTGRLTNRSPASVREPFDAIAPYLNAPVPTPKSAGLLRPSPPFRCPADAVWAQAVGFSYMFWPALFTQVDSSEGWVDPAKVRPVTQAYERGDQYYDVFWSDLGLSTHARIAPSGLSGCNACRFDGAVTWIHISPERGDVP